MHDLNCDARQVKGYAFVTVPLISEELKNVG